MDYSDQSRTMPEFRPNDPPVTVGRFAPSPTGPLHFGSLVAAVASYASCSSWILRIEDIDTPRNAPGATDSILGTLDRMEFVWSTPALSQSTRIDAYRAALDRLKSSGLVYPCGCTRAEIADSNTGTGHRHRP